MDKERIAKHKARVKQFTIQMGKIDKELRWFKERTPILLRKKKNLQGSISDSMKFINDLINSP